MAPDRLLKPLEVADQLRCGKTKVFRLLGQGEIRSIKVGSSRLVPQSELERYIADQLGRRTIRNLEAVS